MDIQKKTKNAKKDKKKFILVNNNEIVLMMGIHFSCKPLDSDKKIIKNVFPYFLNVFQKLD